MKSLNLLLVGLAATAAAQTSDDHAYLGIFVETHVMRIAGMKPRPMPKLPPGVTLPPSTAAMFNSMSGAPTRSLNVRLWSPGIAPDSATATLAIPNGLGLGDKLDLSLYRPQPANPTGGGGGGGGGGESGPPPDFTIKIYWGSSPTVQPGQPKVYEFNKLTMDQQMEMGSHMRSVTSAMSMGGGAHGGGGAGGNYFYKDGWTTGYWPGDTNQPKIGDTASLSGTFNLNSSYTGNVSIDTDAGVDFLPAIEMSSPDLGTKPNLTQAIPFQWSPLGSAIGQYATIIGMQGKNTLIIWSSASNFGDQILGDTDFMQMADVKANVANNVFMPGDTTSMTVPAGIFADADFALFNMVAYGPGSAKDGTQPVPRIQTKSTLMLMLGGKKSKGGDGGGVK